MTEMNNSVAKNEIDNNAVDDIFGMIGTKPEQLKSDPKPKNQDKKETSGKESKADKKPKEEERYTFPFQIYFAGTQHDMTGAFEENREYTAKQITDIMLANHFYEFAGTVDYDYMKDTNTLVAMFAQHKKG